MGYAQLFQQQTILEKDILLAYNESMSFIIFWSILEEISKGFTKINETWNGRYERRPNWKFNNSEYFTQFENKKVYEYLTLPTDLVKYYNKTNSTVNCLKFNAISESGNISKCVKSFFDFYYDTC